MTTPSSILAWRIPCAEEPGRLHSPWDCKDLDMNERLTHFPYTMVPHEIPFVPALAGHISTSSPKSSPRAPLYNMSSLNPGTESGIPAL